MYVVIPCVAGFFAHETERAAKGIALADIKFSIR